jgi:hypothetical protein
MVLPELAVMEQTFELLQTLDPQARRRVLRWVKAALDETEPSPTPEAEDPADTEPVAVEAQPVIEPADTAGAPEAAAAGNTANEAGSTGVDEAPASAGDKTATAAVPSPAPAAEQRRRRAAKAADKPTRRRGAAKATPPPVAEQAQISGNGRRGRPPADEIMRVYRQAGGKLTEVAKHFGKPYGTVQGWASVLREQGYPIGRSRTS